MDRTLVESQQLDVLFEQMLSNRRLTMEQGASTAATVTALAGYPVSSGATGPDAYAYAKEPVINPNLEYADECMDYCVVAQQSWKGMFSDLITCVLCPVLHILVCTGAYDSQRPIVIDFYSLCLLTLLSYRCICSGAGQVSL